MSKNAITDDIYYAFCRFLEAKCGIVLGANKQYLVISRLNPLVSRFNLPSLSALLSSVLSANNRDLVVASIDAMTTNETFWFRDVYPFELLANRIFPELCKTKSSLRIWSSASSSGQEPYSIAITLQEVLNKGTCSSSVSILATDVSSLMLQNCYEGIYDNFALNRGLSPERKRLFFDTVDENRMKIKDSIKRMVSFKSHNLLDSYATLGKFDVIFCRNVLIYFSPEIKSQILKKMAQCLNSGGYLLLGASESLIGLSEDFEFIKCDPGILYKRK